MSRCVIAAAWCGAAAALPVAVAEGPGVVVIDGGQGTVQVQVQAAPAGAAEPGPQKLEPLPPVPQLLDTVMRGFLEGVPGKETLDDVMRRATRRNRAAAAAAEAAQRAQFIRQQAQQFENMLQPLLTAELAFVRRTCGSLSPEARKAVLEAARQEIHDVALRVAKLQFEGDDGGPIDVRRVIHEQVAKAVGPRADAAEFAAYERESAQRRHRREEAARTQIVRKLDERLGLTAVQRQAVLDDLRSGWQPPWIRELGDHGVMSNDQPLAPDFAEACIAPHLDPAQLRAWRQWCEAASAKNVSLNGGIDWSEFNALQHPQPQKLDPWWRP